MIEVRCQRAVDGMVLSAIIFVKYFGLFLSGFAQKKLTVFQSQAFLCNLPQSLMNFHYKQAKQINWIEQQKREIILQAHHSKIRSPVRSNSTVGITLVMNFKKMRRAKCEFTFWPFSLMESDIVFNTLACLQGWTVGIMVFSINGNFSIVKVLSRYSFWMSCLMSSLLTGFPLKSVALKNILGVWQYSSYTMYIVQYLRSSSFGSSYLAWLEWRTITSSPSSEVIFSSSPWMTPPTLFLHCTFSKTRYCFFQSKYLETYAEFNEGIHFQPEQTSVNLSPALLNSSGESFPFYQNCSVSGGAQIVVDTLILILFRLFFAAYHI